MEPVSVLYSCQGDRLDTQSNPTLSQVQKCELVYFCLIFAEIQYSGSDKTYSPCFASISCCLQICELSYMLLGGANVIIKQATHQLSKDCACQLALFYTFRGNCVIQCGRGTIVSIVSCHCTLNCCPEVKPADGERTLFTILCVDKCEQSYCSVLCVVSRWPSLAAEASFHPSPLVQIDLS